MDQRAVRSPGGAKKVIEHNQNVIYHLPKRYTQLDAAMEAVREDLLKILKFCKKLDPIIWQQQYTWFLDNGRLTYQIRGKSTLSVSNRHFNYLCALGLIRKLKQSPDNMTKVNQAFLAAERAKGKRMMPNTFTIYRYTEKQLDLMEKRASELRSHSITAGNISCDKLRAAGLEDLAKEVFWGNNEKSIRNKEGDFDQLRRKIDELCAAKGYATKAELCQDLGWSRLKLDQILNIFRIQWEAEYRYKAPNKQEAEQLTLTSKIWIITRRNENEQN